MRDPLIPVKPPSIQRLPLGRQIECKLSTIMPERDRVRLFNDQKLIIEEKMNGTSRLFHADNGRFTVFTEDMLICKPGLGTGTYKIPARYCIFDVFDSNPKTFMSFTDKQDFVRMLKENKVRIAELDNSYFFKVFCLGYGEFTMEQITQLLELTSHYAYDPEKQTPTFMEGLVVKPARSLFLVEYEEVVGKLIRNEFLYGKNGIQENYRRIPTHNNEINPSFTVPDMF